MTEKTVGKVPQIRFKGYEGEWSNTTFQTACSLLTGHPFQSKQFTKSGFFLVRGMNVKRGYVDNSKQISEFWPSSRGLEVFLLKTDDIVIQMDGALIGRSYAKISQENLPALLVQRVTRARCENTSNSDYIYQYIERDFLKYIRATKTETAVPHLSLDDIRQFPISISTPTEQAQIGEYFRELDGLIGLHQRKHAKLVTLKKSMLQKMFPQPGATAPEIRFKGFSEDWKKEKLGTISDSYSGGTPSVGNRTYYGGGIPFIRSAEINAISTELTLTEFGLRDSAAKMVSEGDILYALYGATSGEVGISQINGAINQAVLAIKPHAGYSSQFIATWLRNRKVQIIGTYLQGGQGNLSGAIVKSLHLDLPCIEEQQKIGTYFRTLDALISKHAIQLQKLKQIKSACLEKMFV